MMSNLRPAPFHLRASVVRALVGDVRVIAKGMAAVPVLGMINAAPAPELTEFSTALVAPANDELTYLPATEPGFAGRATAGRTRLGQRGRSESVAPAGDPDVGDASPPPIRKPITAGKLRKAERNQRIAAAYAAGEECREIAAREGLSSARVLSIANAEGVPSRQVGKNRRIPDLDRKAVADLYANGMPLRAVADRFGVSKSTAKACLIELGAELRPVGKRSPGYRPKPKIKSAATRLSKGASATTLTPALEGTSGGVTGGCYESPANAGEQHEKPAAAVLRQAQDERVEVAAAAAPISDTANLKRRWPRSARAKPGRSK